MPYSIDAIASVLETNDFVHRRFDSRMIYFAALVGLLSSFIDGANGTLFRFHVLSNVPPSVMTFNGSIGSGLGTRL